MEHKISLAIIAWITTVIIVRMRMEVCIVLAARVINAKEFTAFTVRKQIAVLPVAVGIVLAALISENVLIVTGILALTVSVNVLVVTRILALTVSLEQVATILAVRTKSRVITVLKMAMLSDGATDVV
mmetsp:Transcript_11635/g.17909  ORF Transcript_11635/g.17909 Transcript_11635/m.17909 type:complete len:128 (-) Transcript_11635:58-441(-)